jgi:hypothetical protein
MLQSHTEIRSADYPASIIVLTLASFAFQARQRASLLSTPSELLSEIFQYADDASDPLVLVSPISRAILPFQRTVLYRHVRLTGSSSIYSFVDSVSNNRELGKLVRSLVIEAPYGRGERGTQDLRCFRVFLSKLVNLVELEVGGGGCKTLLSLILLRRTALEHLPSMQSLTFPLESQPKRTFDAKLLQPLQSYPSLRRLVVSDESKLGKYKATTNAPTRLTKINELTLVGTFAVDADTAPVFSAFPNLVSLTLDSGYKSSPDFGTLLPFVPTSISSLSLRTTQYNESQPVYIDSLLPRFTSLTRLYLGRSTFSPDIASFLLQLPFLETLGFGVGVDLPLPDIRVLAIDTEGLRLKKVILDQAEGKIGWRIRDSVDGATLNPAHRRSLNGKHHGSGWSLPSLRFVDQDRSLYLQSVDELVKSLREAGIAVEGTLPQVGEVFRLYAEEVVECQIAYSWTAGTEQEALRKTFGADMVDNFLRRRGKL